MLGALLLAALLAGAGELSPAARVLAQRDIERARYAFVIGNSKPFDELYPRSVFEARVARQVAAEAALPRVLRPPAGADEGAPLPIDPEMASVLERELEKPGDVTTILEQRDRFEVFRLISVTDDVWEVEAIRFPKVDFEAWFSRIQKP